MSITFYCRQREDYPAFNQAYFTSFHIDPDTAGPWHEAFAPLVEHDFPTISITIEEDEDTEELSRLLDHYKFVIRPFVVPPKTSIFDFNAGYQIHGWTEWYKFQYRAVMQPAKAMQDRLFERGRSDILRRGGVELTLEQKVRNKSTTLTFAETQVLAKLTLIHRMRLGFMLVHRALENFKVQCSTQSRIQVGRIKDFVTGTKTTRLLLKPDYTPLPWNYLDLPNLEAVTRVEASGIVAGDSSSRAASSANLLVPLEDSVDEAICSNLDLDDNSEADSSFETEIVDLTEPSELRRKVKQQSGSILPADLQLPPLMSSDALNEYELVKAENDTAKL